MYSPTTVAPKPEFRCAEADAVSASAWKQSARPGAVNSRTGLAKQEEQAPMPSRPKGSTAQEPLQSVEQLAARLAALAEYVELHREEIAEQDRIAALADISEIRNALGRLQGAAASAH